MEEYNKKTPKKVEEFLGIDNYKKKQCRYIDTVISKTMEDKEEIEKHIETIYKTTNKYYKAHKKVISTMVPAMIMETLENVLYRNEASEIHLEAVLTPNAAVFILEGGNFYKNDEVKQHYEKRHETDDAELKKEKILFLEGFSDFVHVSKKTGYIYVGINEKTFFDIKEDKKKKI